MSAKYFRNRGKALTSPFLARAIKFCNSPRAAAWAGSSMMDFATPADSANALAAAITVKRRRHWLGHKPVDLITATKSFSGKGTVMDFIRGSIHKADILYEAIDWPMQTQLQRQFHADPDIGIVIVDNVRTDSAGGRDRFIRSAFLESFLTNDEIVLASPGAGPVLRLENQFVIAINTNEGRVSTDLLNRRLSIHLAPKGDVGERECPLDDNVQHSLKPWARVIGGILNVNGFKDFLANSAVRRSADDPTREALAILGAAKPGKKLRPREWGRHAVTHGLAKALFPPNERDTDKGRERAIGVVLKRHLDETFTAQTETKILRLRLEGGLKRWVKGKNPHVRYVVTKLVETGRPTDDEVSSQTAESSRPQTPGDGVVLTNGNKPAKKGHTAK